MALTDTAIRNAKPGATPRKLKDGGWLYLHVMPSGRKSWRMGYRLAGKENTLTLGTYPQMSLADAREARNKARTRIEAGLPAEGDDAPPAPTFMECAQAWHSKWAVNVSAIHAQRVWRRLEMNVLDELGPVPMPDITTGRILTALRGLEERGALDMLKRTRQTIAEVTGMAVASGIIQTDPAYRLEKAVTKPRKTEHFSCLPFSDMPEFLSKLDRYDGHGLTQAAIRFAILTWARSNEVRFATWDEIDGDTWRIPADRMKAGREHVVPLSQQAQDLLASLPRIKGSNVIFWSGASAGGAMSENTMIYAMYRMGYHSRATIHGFRRTASTWANEQMINDTQRRYDADWIELQLSHVEANKVRGAYNAATYMAARRQMLQDWADSLDHAKGD